MKKVLVLLLLISVGLNLGLGLTLLRNQSDDGPRHDQWRPGEGPPPVGGPPPDGGPGEGDPFGRDFLNKKLQFLSEKLGLEDGQLAAFRKVHVDASIGIRQQAERVREARLSLRQTAATPEQEDLRGAIAKVGQEQARLDSLVTEVMFQELEILNQDQRQEYLGLMPADRFEGRFGRKPRGHGRPPRAQ